MRGDSPSAAELLSAMERISTQVQHIRGQGRDAFLDGDVESGVLQAATCHLIIQFQAVLDDLPPGWADQNSDLPFSAVRGMRNRLAHGYTDIDSLLLWNTVDEALPAFLAELVTRIAPVDR